MAGCSIRILIMAALLMAAVHLQVSAQECQSDIEGLIRECTKYVTKIGPKIPPSQACCDVVKNANFQCVCQHVTQQVEQIISIDKVVYVADTCGKPLPHGQKCGDITIP
ncbi:PREDICTED: uncharacterized protein LOC109115535 [Nelumbo nucifera]|nr:PREDICTED: uncharacterized protein LOC109115534 [Nelumbo nucifera]XP_019055235.1 PREDICTED: uncharacterized protein LOC109115535 [Nelumbo nucifera]DAD42546.1 TPA_asm: hypothetical protein HUJ06_000776 [Nelumbo nucifera]DAD44136.1 TPA_asm: hypothetical protein HUJ06_002366 [Nelumbo nucifera]